MKGYIYKIVDNTNNNTYYGSTIQKINHRMNSHRECLRKYKSGKKITGLTEAVKIMINEDYYNEVVEEVDFNEKIELLTRERYWIENNECINIVIPTRTNKEYCKEYYQKNKDKKLQQVKEHYQKNKEEVNEKKNEKILCECGIWTSKNNKAQHCKSIRHINIMEGLN